MNSTRRCAILGATGFIGGQIARAALAAGWRVRAVRRRAGSVGALGDVAEQIEWAPGDLDDVGSLVAALNGCELLFHAAAYYPQDSHDLPGQVAYARAQMGRVLEAARQAQPARIVYTSTLTTLGPPAEPGRLANERDFYRPGSSRSAYYEAKFAMERMALQAAADGLPIIVLLPTAVVGPGDVKPTTGQLLLEVARGRIPLALDAAINLVDGRDVAASHVAAAGRGRLGERYILGGHNLSVRAALSAAAQIAGVSPPRLSLPRPWVEKLVRWLDLLPGLALPEHARGLHLWQPASSLKAGRELGHTARSFEETVEDTLAWFRQEGYL